MQSNNSVFFGDKSHNLSGFNLRSELISFYTPYRGFTAIQQPTSRDKNKRRLLAP